MNEKTLLIGALSVTAIAAGVAVLAHADRSEREKARAIVPVARLDAARFLQTERPIRLTSSGPDPASLHLVVLSASTAIEDPLALTEVHLTFANPEGRALDGTFRIVLPAGASVSRFATRVGDVWEEGEVVEKGHGQQAYEASRSSGHAPALLEHAIVGELTAHISAIPPRGEKEIIVAYSEVLGSGAPYVLPLAGLPSLASIDIDVRAASPGAPRPAGGERRFAFHEKNFAPGQDFVVDARAIPRRAALRSGTKVVARVVPFATSRPDPIGSVVVLVDTSASRVNGLAAQTHLVQRVIRRLPPAARVTVACFDQDVAPIYDGPASGFDEAQAEAIISREALGASDLQEALAWAGAKALALGAHRVVVVGDGIATAGEVDTQRIRQSVQKLRAQKVERIDAIAIGGVRDEAFLRAVVHGVLDRDGAVLDASIGEDGIAARLSETTFSGIPVTVERATWSWPQSLDGLQAGDEVIVHAELPTDAPLQINVGGQTLSPEVRPAEPLLVERAWAQAKIQSLLEAPIGSADASRAEIVGLGTKHHLVSPFTALLVVHGAAERAHFDRAPSSGQDILTVVDGRVVVKSPPPPAEQAPSATATATPSAIAGGDMAPAPVPPSPSPPSPRPRAGKEQAVQAVEDSPYAIAPYRVPVVPVAIAIVPPTTPRTPIAQVPAPAPAPAPAPVPAPPTPAPHAPAHRPAPAPRPAPVAAKPKPSTKVLDRTDPWNEPHGRPVSPRDGEADLKEPAPSSPPTPPATTKAKRSEASLRKPATTRAKLAATPHDGRFKRVMDRLASGTAGDTAEALAEARRWRVERPADVLALVALGEAFEASGDAGKAARAYGSIVELYPDRASLRRLAGERLDRVAARPGPAGTAALRLALDTYAKALSADGDRPSSHRLYAFALVAHGEHERAFEVLRSAARRHWDDERFPGAELIFNDDAALVAAAWRAAAPAQAREIQQRCADAGLHLPSAPSLRFVLVWETDDSDVDLHVYDGAGGHGSFGEALPSGGQLYGDVTLGFGPEVFLVERPAAYPYVVRAHYASRDHGALGFGMGKLEWIQHDGKGNLRFEQRPFVVTTDDAVVDLARVDVGTSPPEAPGGPAPTKVGTRVKSHMK